MRFNYRAKYKALKLLIKICLANDDIFKGHRVKNTRVLKRIQ